MSGRSLKLGKRMEMTALNSKLRYHSRDKKFLELSNCEIIAEHSNETVPQQKCVAILAGNKQKENSLFRFMDQESKSNVYLDDGSTYWW